MSSKRLKRNSAPAAQSDSDGEEDSEVQGDQMSTSTSHQLRKSEENLKKSMAMDVGLRKVQGQQRLEKEFDSQFREIEVQIDERVNRFQQDTKRFQGELLTRLLALTKRKEEVEKQIIQEVQELATAHETIKQEFETILQGRSADVREAIEALHQAEKAAAKPH
ncbi:hypothetical protein Z517_02314 [Fonsecaea pedrosoi CBS 271.37]|uniref:Uncharacterized protein n=1 Tax=Fonsecaea pedrosoi CBS 271.37 TaxID=1442368 RepID=A0A0D2DZ76_9EURO|nr:uncharacterized protein Z517_02314 [Fonsecaea pedrosoi CBS 271.37]KIW83071.1 hypothetical protein Z517_02314 [Fonsecaea pedrosoi CBS 271.37]